MRHKSLGRRTNKMNEQWAVVTGASSGIGEEFARQLAQVGFHVLLVARRADRLEKIMRELPTPGKMIVCDLSDCSDRKRLKEEMQKLPLGILVNNAGFGRCGNFEENRKSGEEMIRLNIESVHDLTHEALRIMSEQRCGTILNVASCAGLLPCGPYMTDYYATKAYVRSMTEGIAEELRRAGSLVRVYCLCPGPVDTEFNSVANVRFALPGISSKKCVKEALKGIQRRKVTIIPSFLVRAGIFCQKLLPEWMVVRIIAHSQKKKIEC